MGKRKTFREKNPAAAFISNLEVKNQNNDIDIGTDINVDKDVNTKLDTKADDYIDEKLNKAIKNPSKRKISQRHKANEDIVIDNAKNMDTDISIDISKKQELKSKISVPILQKTTEPIMKPSIAPSEADVIKSKKIYKPKEVKSKKVMILTKPSTHEAMQRIANKRYTSVNDLINTLMEDFIAVEG
jgi:predicted HicB family RNase H-like nuclease